VFCDFEGHLHLYQNYVMNTKFVRMEVLDF